MKSNPISESKEKDFLLNLQRGARIFLRRKKKQKGRKHPRKGKREKRDVQHVLSKKERNVGPS